MDESVKNGIEVLTGEDCTRFQGKRDFISLTDDIDTAMDYAEMKPSEKVGKGSFPVMLGISLEDAKKLETINIHSDRREIGVLGNIPPEYISFISVPENKVEFVRKLVNNDKIKVCPFEPEKRFYQKTPFGDIDFDDKKAKKVLHEQNSKGKIFSIDEIKALTLGRVKSKIQESIRKMQNLIKDNFKRKDAYER